MVSAAIACSTLEAQLVKDQWAEVLGHGNAREDFITAVFAQFLDENPAAAALFDRVRGDNIYSPEFRAHALRVLGGIDLLVGALDQTPRFDASAAHLKGQHDSRGIAAEYWGAFVDVLLDVVPDRIGLCFAYDAWNSCLNRIVGGIQ